MNEDENTNFKSLFLAIILCVGVIMLSNYLFPVKHTPPRPQPEATSQVQEIPAGQPEEQPAAPLEVSQALEQDSRINIQNEALSGSIRLKGARFDNIVLRKYKQGLEKDSPEIELLSPSQTAHPYYAEFGWLSSDNSLKLPNSETRWTAKGKELSPDTPIILEWNNGQGFRFIRSIKLDKNYMFTITDSVENNTGRKVSLFPYGLISRTPDASAAASGIIHSGISSVVDNTLHELKYDSLDRGESKDFTTSGGWAGFSDHYWFSALVLDNNQESLLNLRNTNGKNYQIDYRGQAMQLQPGSIISNSVRFFAGAKEIKLLDDYKNNLGIPKFDLAVDFGWYYFLTKPFFYILDFLFNLIGNMGWAILLFAALLRLAMFPIAGKSFESMSKMKKLQPKLEVLKERYGDDKMKLQQETMNLYRKEKINPAAGCLPLLIQIPVFFSLYKVLNIAIEIRHAPFIGWIKDLSAPDPLTLSVITHLPVPGLLDIGVWPIIMGLTMYIQQKLNPSPANKDQARMFAMLPVIFTFMLGHFASGLVIYWTLSNILSIIQQKAIMKKNGV